MKSRRVFGLALEAGGMFFCAVSARFFKYWLPVMLWMAMIFGASTGLGGPVNTSRFIRPILVWLFPNMPEKEIEEMHHAIRKTAHFAEYTILGLLVWRLIRFDAALAALRPRSYAAALLVCALYAATDEFHQLFVPGREAAVADVMLDTCGAGAGLAALCAARRRGKQK